MVPMNSIDSVQSGRASSPRQRQINHRSRARTGCLVCRARKVKCDEQRPSCQRCAKIKRKCIYKRTLPPMPQQLAPQIVDHQQHQNSLRKEPSISPGQNRNTDLLLHRHLVPPECPSNPAESGTVDTSEDVAQPPQCSLVPVEGGVSLCNQPEVSSLHHGINLNDADSPSARFYTTSLQMYVATALDWWGVCGMPSQPFAYFLEEVDSPILSPFDYLNWKRIKLHITHLATQNESISAAIHVVQNVYRAQVNRLPMFHAISEYQAALATFELMVASETVDFDAVLVDAFLLCLCETILPNEDGPAFHGFSSAFETSLAAWLLSIDRSPISLRIATWLQFLHVSTKRAGCCGLLPETTFNLLSSHITEVPNVPLFGNHSSSASAMFDIICAPVYAFYLELQRISNQIQDLSHYRRSRMTPEDQAEVTDIVNSLRSTLSALWNARPSPLRYQPSQLRENFCQEIAEPLIALVGICTAAYFGEVIGLRRTLGDDPFPSPESEEAMRQIRDTVEGEWNISKGALNPGYIRSLFLYSIETVQDVDTQWAVGRLKQVKSPTSRSEFIACLGESLARAQRMEKRRVATKYFCSGTFKVMVPRM